MWSNILWLLYTYIAIYSWFPPTCVTITCRVACMCMYVSLYRHSARCNAKYMCISHWPPLCVCVCAWLYDYRCFLGKAAPKLSALSTSFEICKLLEVLHGGADVLGQLAVFVALAPLPFLHHLHNILLHQPITQLWTTHTYTAQNKSHTINSAGCACTVCIVHYRHRWDSTAVWCSVMLLSVHHARVLHN